MNFFTNYLLLFIIFSPVRGQLEYPENQPEAVNLYVYYRPYYAFTFNSSSVSKTVSLGIHNSINRHYKLNVVIESMSGCSNADKASLVIDNGKKLQFCTDVRNGDRNYQTVKEVYNGERQVNITMVGNWTDLEAHLVASVYYEVAGGCENCNDDFCCDHRESQCNSVSTNSIIVRCIPRKSMKDRKSLLCDGHPNCGRFCNADESDAFCKKEEIDINCSRNNCSVDIDGLKVTLIILGIFALLSLVYAIIVMSSAVREFLGISSFFPFNRNSHEDVDENHSTADSNSVRSIFVYVNNLNIATISRPENDSPPNYDELEFGNKIEIKVEEINNGDLDLPSFTEAVSFEYRGFPQVTSSGNGILNPAYEHYYGDSQSQKSDVEKY